MSRRERWQQVLDAEVHRWSAMPYQDLVAALHETDAYVIERDEGKYQVEISILEDAERYLHVGIAVDDGSLPASIVPASRTFRRDKPASTC